MEFIQKYAKIESDSNKEQLINDEKVTVSNQEFIDGISIFQDQNPSDYYGLKNVAHELEDLITDRSYVDIFDDLSDPENYTPECFDETEINYDKFDCFNIKIDCFKKDLKIFVGKSKHSFCNAILYATISKLNKEKYFSKIKMK